MVGFNPLRRAAVGNKAAPVLGLWPACVLMRLNATGINNCSIHALAGLGCTNSTWNIVFLVSWKAVDEWRPGSSLLLGAVDLAYLLQKYSVSFSHYTVTPGANPNSSVETFYKEQLPTDLVQLDVLFQKARGEGINIEVAGQSMKRKFLLILSGNYFSIALVNQYKLRKYERISSKCHEEARESFGAEGDLLLMNKHNQISCLMHAFEDIELIHHPSQRGSLKKIQKLPEHSRFSSDQSQVFNLEPCEPLLLLSCDKIMEIQFIKFYNSHGNPIHQVL